jgi:dolichyl-diphosphooligosaccharide--protein glycosyltransferase
VPLFFTPQGNLNLGSAFGAFGFCLLISLAALFLLSLEWNGDKSKSEGIFFLVWSAFSIYLALSQQRFSYQLAINVSILASYMLWVLLESFDFENELRKLVKLKQKNEKNISSTLLAGKEIKLNAKSKMKSKNMSVPVKKISASSKSSGKPDYFKIVSSLALIGLVFVPCLWMGSAYANSGTLIPAWQESLNWLKNSSPQTSYYQQPSENPEYGVLSWWDYGNWIVYLSNRPAVSNNFQTNVDETARFFMSDSEKEAKEIMDKFKVKYVITDSLMLAANDPSTVKHRRFSEPLASDWDVGGKDALTTLKQVPPTQPRSTLDRSRSPGKLHLFTILHWRHPIRRCRRPGRFMGYSGTAPTAPDSTIARQQALFWRRPA